MITFKQLNKTYKKNHVLKNIDLEMAGSGVVALLGPNGSGKTTMLKCFLGMVLPESGDIIFDGQSILGKYEYRSKVSYLPQIARFPDNLSARELISLMKEIKPGTTREARFIEVFNREKELDKKMSSLSGGTRQKVNIILALMHDDPLIILDEPSTGLDPLSLQELKKFIREEKENGKLVIITTHILSLAEDLADEVLFLLEGNIYFNGPLQQLLNDQHGSSLEMAIAQILRTNKEIAHA
ncbi:ABC transporter ATP-binding protein [Portibacter lacus]|uniref:ABC transporter ATP-binding protein n=1 Tax=Portibacter lacus TaxID=1099794 RepID=A0AA37WEN9_9BACT|nr:ABC transporter ATP-binding protein [Portibacter lacus]GLR17607.1 ABC transporter ATP-binding protein [Portibacter lacus]